MWALFITVACLLQDGFVASKTRLLNGTIRCCAWFVRATGYYSRESPALSEFIVKTPHNDTLHILQLARAFYWWYDTPTCTDLCNWLELFGVHAIRATIVYKGAKIELNLVERKHTDGRELDFDSVLLDDLRNVP